MVIPELRNSAAAETHYPLARNYRVTDILLRRFAVSPHAVESAVADETVILHLENGTYYGLDKVGTEIWTLLKNGLAPAQICQRIADEYKVDVMLVEGDVRKFLHDAEAQGILVNG